MSNMTNMHSGVFIIGAPRSGTTLLQSIIASHSEFFSPPETSFFYRAIPLIGTRYSDPECIVDAGALDIIKHDVALMTGIDQIELKAGLTAKGTFESLVKFFNESNKPKWVEKTTNHAQTMMAINRYYPDAKFLHIIRDPVDAITSMISIKPNSMSDFRLSYFPSVRMHAKLWNSCVSSAFSYPIQKNVFHVFYEDLILRPEETIRQVCSFLSVSYEPSMINDFHISAERIFSDKYCPWQKNNLAPGFHTDSIHRWRNEIKDKDTWLIQYYTDYWSRYLGYYELVKTPIYRKLIQISLDLGKWGMSRLNIESMIRSKLMRVRK